jgi:hypothetical protein
MRSSARRPSGYRKIRFLDLAFFQTLTLENRNFGKRKLRYRAEAVTDPPPHPCSISPRGARARKFELGKTHGITTVPWHLASVKGHRLQQVTIEVGAALPQREISMAAAFSQRLGSEVGHGHIWLDQFCFRLGQ